MNLHWATSYFPWDYELNKNITPSVPQCSFMLGTSVFFMLVMNRRFDTHFKVFIKYSFINCLDFFILNKNLIFKFLYKIKKIIKILTFKNHYWRVFLLTFDGHSTCHLIPNSIQKHGVNMSCGLGVRVCLGVPLKIVGLSEKV